jgi:UDP-glucose 4-epimerase
MSLSLVIGGAGFVGSHLVDTLLARGQRVRVLDNFSTGTRTNLPQSHAGLEIIHGDINDSAEVSRATAGVTYVFHLATPSHASCGDSPPVDHWTNCTIATLKVLAIAHKACVKRLIYSSCESVYGPAVVKPLTENDPTVPLSPYAFAKLTGEQQCVAFSAMYGLETVRLRYFNVFGPRHVFSGVRRAAISGILKTMLLGQVPTIEGDGDVHQDFIYVDDVVHANLLAAEAPRVSGKVYNIARGRSTTLNEVVATINGILGTQFQPRCAETQPADSGTRLSEIARAEVELGFCAATDLDQGLRRCIAYYRAHPEELVAASHTGNNFDGPHFSRDPQAWPLSRGDRVGTSISTGDESPASPAQAGETEKSDASASGTNSSNGNNGPLQAHCLRRLTLERLLDEDWLSRRS